MVKAVGNVVYADLAVKLKPRGHPFRNGLKILVVLGILFFLYRRFVKK